MSVKSSTGLIQGKFPMEKGQGPVSLGSRTFVSVEQKDKRRRLGISGISQQRLPLEIVFLIEL